MHDFTRINYRQLLGRYRSALMARTTSLWHIDPTYMKGASC